MQKESGWAAVRLSLWTSLFFAQIAGERPHDSQGEEEGLAYNNGANDIILAVHFRQPQVGLPLLEAPSVLVNSQLPCGLVFRVDLI